MSPGNQVTLMLQINHINRVSSPHGTDEASFIKSVGIGFSVSYQYYQHCCIFSVVSHWNRDLIHCNNNARRLSSNTNGYHNIQTLGSGYVKRQGFIPAEGTNLGSMGLLVMSALRASYAKQQGFVPALIKQRHIFGGLRMANLVNFPLRKFKSS